MDVEAQRAAESKRKRRRAEDPGSPATRGVASTSRDNGRHAGSSRDTSDEDMAAEYTPTQGSRDGSLESSGEGRFGWVMTGVRKGVRHKQRRALAQCIIDAWSSLEDSGGAPRVSRRELYRRCFGIGVKPNEISMELVTMRDAGLVALEGDEVVYVARHLLTLRLSATPPPCPSACLERYGGHQSLLQRRLHRR